MFCLARAERVRARDKRARHGESRSRFYLLIARLYRSPGVPAGICWFAKNGQPGQIRSRKVGRWRRASARIKPGGSEMKVGREMNMDSITACESRSDAIDTGRERERERARAPTTTLIAAPPTTSCAVRLKSARPTRRRRRPPAHSFITHQPLAGMSSRAAASGRPVAPTRRGSRRRRQ